MRAILAHVRYVAKYRFLLLIRHVMAGAILVLLTFNDLHIIIESRRFIDMFDTTRTVIWTKSEFEDGQFLILASRDCDAQGYGHL